MSRWPLRWVIPSIALVLVLLTELVLGLATLALLRSTLTDQVDRKLEEAALAITEHPGDLLALLGEPGTASDVDAVRPSNQVIVSVFRADGQPARALNRRLNNARPVPRVRIDLDSREPYTSRDAREQWRVLVTTVGDGQATVAVMMPLRDTGDTATALRRGMVALGVVVALLAAGLAAWATRRSLRPLSEAEHTAAAIASGDLERRVPDYPPTSEAGSLARSLNAMLDQLTASMAARAASEERLRRFVSDASHELRTPLAAIRGYAELHRMGADADDAAMARVEANAERMAGLVEDLLLLARYDEGAATLTGQEEVDVAALLEDAAADLRAQDPTRDVTVTTAAGCTVRGSRRHLSQLLANLAGNVLAHTPAGSPVEMAAGRSGETVVVSVRDHGPGFGPGHAERAFERFYRADASRTRETGGSGLGLAIVAALVHAHGGTVEAADADEGAVVTVRLPAAEVA